MGTESNMPVARVESVSPRRFPWLLPLLAVLFAIYLAAEAWIDHGPTITVYAAQGHGLGVGDPLRYRGVDVGRLLDLELTEDLGQVALQVQLEPEARGLCRAGSQFWIVRPRMAFDSVQGLETIVGARYLSVLPGTLDDPVMYEFDALIEAPIAEEIEEAGLHLSLEAPVRSNLSSGAQITYRGIVVGSVLATRLASDAGSVEIDVYIRPSYTELVRTNTWFWKTGGLEVSMALAGGLSVKMDSLRTLLIGGLAFATPTDAGDTVTNGAAFFVHPNPHEEMDEWRPALIVGIDDTPVVDVDGYLARAELQWESGKFLRRDGSSQGCVVRLPQGILGPDDLLLIPRSAKSGELKVSGKPVSLEDPLLWQGRGLALRARKGLAQKSLSPTQVRFAPELQDCLAYAPDQATALSLSHTRLSASTEGWELDPDFEVESSWHGALVFGRGDEQFVGILLVSEDGSRIAPFMAAAWEN
ncbi:MAG: paraquat-inducible protein B [Planctomycetota bacterium]|jgi:paraquat-inducible protein B